MTIKLKSSGFSNVLGKLDKLVPTINQRGKILLERLADVGIMQADVNFNFAIYDGYNDVVVDATPEWVNDNKLVINARGQAVAFIEFGTGIENLEEHPKAAELGMIRGAYGKGKGIHETWTYYGDSSETAAGGMVVASRDGKEVIQTRGNNPNYAMYDAAKEMRMRVYDIAKEVFGDGY